MSFRISRYHQSMGLITSILYRQFLSFSAIGWSLYWCWCRWSLGEWPNTGFRHHMSNNITSMLAVSFPLFHVDWLMVIIIGLRHFSFTIDFFLIVISTPGLIAATASYDYRHIVVTTSVSEYRHYFLHCHAFFIIIRHADMTPRR